MKNNRIIHVSKQGRYDYYAEQMEITDLKALLYSKVGKRKDISIALRKRAWHKWDENHNKQDKISTCYDYFKCGARLLQHKL